MTYNKVVNMIFVMGIRSIGFYFAILVIFIFSIKIRSNITVFDEIVSDNGYKNINQLISTNPQ